MNRLQVTFRGFPPSDALSSKIGEHADKLHKTFERINACHVTIEQPHRHHNHGRMFHVNIVIEVPGKEIAITRPGSDHENAYVACHEAFKTAKRRLQDYSALLKREIKEHSQPDVSTAA
jgi:ribosome-associated translation inhibitor RaiA